MKLYTLIVELEYDGDNEPSLPSLERQVGSSLSRLSESGFDLLNIEAAEGSYDEAFGDGAEDDEDE